MLFLWNSAFLTVPYDIPQTTHHRDTTHDTTPRSTTPCCCCYCYCVSYIPYNYKTCQERGRGSSRGHNLVLSCGMAEGEVSPHASSSKSATAGSFKRLRGDGELTRYVCVIGVSERDDDALREVSLSFGKVSSIERNAKVSPVHLCPGGGVV